LSPGEFTRLAVAGIIRRVRHPGKFTRLAVAGIIRRVRRVTFGLAAQTLQAAIDDLKRQVAGLQDTVYATLPDSASHKDDAVAAATAAVQGLQAAVETLKNENAAIHKENAAIRKENAAVREALYAALPDSAPPARKWRRSGDGPAPEGKRPEPERRLRVLHIGNIANNAYLAARILNEDSFDCDVLCHDYYHIMGSPEWEDADFTGSVGSDDVPDWGGVDLRGFQRPRWFAQGRLDTCVRYLLARRRGQLRDAAALWWRLGPNEPVVAHQDTLSEEEAERLVADFREAFPERRDVLSVRELTQFVGIYSAPMAALRALLDEYDVVVGFGIGGIWPLVAGKRSYLAFEHGTIRSIPFEDTTLGRLTALTYRHAAGVVITNCDNHRAAERLQVAEYRFVPHPVNEKWIRPGVGEAVGRALREELDADFLIFHPARQHWDERRDPSLEKGNDIFIRGLARFFREGAPRAAAIFVSWGRDVERSRDLLRELGAEDRVKWVPTQHNCDMSRLVDASDLVADQFFLGAFGNIMPKALATRRASMLYLDPGSHHWCFPEMPPVINVSTPDEVFEGLCRAYRDPAWLRELAERGPRWYEAYHSEAVVRTRLAAFYRDVLARGRESEPKPGGTETESSAPVAEGRGP
jgi:glycosyltransferase involved in cell wall biosynthesis